MKLKKILSLILRAAIMTTGGVYATWNYATNDADSYKANIMKPAMAKAEISASVGTLSVNTEALKVTIDDLGGDKVADLVIEGEVVITFTPNSGASPDIQDNGIEIKYSITGAADPQYQGRSIFAFAPVTDQTLATAKSWTISAAELQDIVTLNGSISLPTYDEYQEFQQLLPSNLLSITVAQV